MVYFGARLGHDHKRKTHIHLIKQPRVDTRYTSLKTRHHRCFSEEQHSTYNMFASHAICMRVRRRHWHERHWGHIRRKRSETFIKSTAYQPRSHEGARNRKALQYRCRLFLSTPDPSFSLWKLKPRPSSSLYSIISSHPKRPTLWSSL